MNHSQILPVKWESEEELYRTEGHRIWPDFTPNDAPTVSFFRQKCLESSQVLQLGFCRKHVLLMQVKLMETCWEISRLPTVFTLSFVDRTKHSPTYQTNTWWRCLSFTRNFVPRTEDSLSNFVQTFVVSVICMLFNSNLVQTGWSPMKSQSDQEWRKHVKLTGCQLQIRGWFNHQLRILFTNKLHIEHRVGNIWNPNVDNQGAHAQEKVTPVVGYWYECEHVSLTMLTVVCGAT